jgi:SAM-dependent methyltransferase
MSEDLKGALALSGPEACLAYYRDWAASYDHGFATDMEYLLPAHVAAAFMGTGAKGPVLDVGAGTGLLAEALRDMGLMGPIDAVDFSPEMLAVAAEKGLYEGLVQADITRPLAFPRSYAGVVSSGTFTAGHVGPEALPQLLAVTAPGAQFALSINLADLAAQGRITDRQEIEVQVYGAAAARIDADHATDRALVALFRAA